MKGDVETSFFAPSTSTHRSENVDMTQIFQFQSFLISLTN